MPQSSAMSAATSERLAELAGCCFVLSRDRPVAHGTPQWLPR